MKKIYLHEYTLRELLLTEAIDDNFKQTSLPVDDDELIQGSNFDLENWKKEWNRPDLPGRSFFAKIGAFWRPLQEEYEQYNDTLLQKIKTDPKNPWSHVFKFMEWEEEGSPDLKALWADKDFRYPQKQDQMLSSIGRRYTPAMKDDPNWNKGSPWEKFTPETTIEDIFEEHGIEGTIDDWKPFLDFIGISEKSNEGEWLQDNVHLAANFIGGGGKAFSQAINGVISTLGAGSVATWVANAVEYFVPTAFGTFTKGIAAKLLASLGTVALVGLILGKLDETLDEKRKEGIKVDMEAHFVKLIKQDNACAKLWEKWFTELEKDIFDHFLETPTVLPKYTMPQLLAMKTKDIEFENLADKMTKKIIAEER